MTAPIAIILFGIIIVALGGMIFAYRDDHPKKKKRS